MCPHLIQPLEANFILVLVCIIKAPSRLKIILTNPLHHIELWPRARLSHSKHSKSPPVHCLISNRSFIIIST